MRQNLSKQLTGKRSIVWLILLIMLTIIVLPTKSEAVTKENSYLVLIHNRDNTWTAYENLIEESPEGSLMVKAKSISEALNYKYQILKNGNFTIQKSKFRNNVYERGNQDYLFQCSSSTRIAKTTICAPYTSKKYGCNICHFSTLNTMLYSKYYPALLAVDYKKAGYKGVICYSKYAIIADVPDINNVINAKGNKFFSNTDPVETEEHSDHKDSVPHSDNKLIIVGDSRTNNMSKWVKTSVNTEFIAKEGEGYEWFCTEAIKKVDKIREPGDVILIWLGVNDYNSEKLGDKSWISYADKINALAQNHWKDCKIYVAEVGYVDSNLMKNYYGIKTKSNVTQLYIGTKIKGIQQFNLYLKRNLNDSITWITTNSTLKIQSNDKKTSNTGVWITKSNGKKDGLHYKKDITQKVYDHFVQKTMENL